MSPITSFALETTAMIASLALVQAAVLLMRSANRSTWLKPGDSDTLLTVTIGVIILLAIGLEVDGLIRAGVEKELAILAGPVVCAVISRIIWLGFNCRARLAMAEAGLSPFGHLTDAARRVPDQAREPKAE